jgi:muramoyltetrapeptide carboxypeptidase
MLFSSDQIVRVEPHDLNAALRDRSVRAIAVSADHTVLDDLDVAAARADPKPIIGTGGTTFVHLELLRRCGVVGFHGAPTAAAAGPIVGADRDLRVPGRAEGPLRGGSLAVIRAMIGAGLPDLDGAILLLTGERNQGLGQVDRQLNHLRRAGILDRVCGVVVGVFTGFEGLVDREWTLRDVLADHLAALSVPVLAGLPIGPGHPPVPIGADATLDAHEGTLIF